MAVTRILPDAPGSWTLYEIFENRVRSFIKEYLPETNEVRAIQDLREKWIKTPLLTGYFLAEDGQQAFGHLCSYMSDHFGSPYILLWQTQIDPSPFSAPAIREVGVQLREWMAAYNKILEAAKRPERVTSGESFTWIEPDIYVRLLRSMGFEIKADRHVFRWSLKE